jgi:hypothetical protein
MSYLIAPLSKKRYYKCCDKQAQWYLSRLAVAKPFHVFSSHLTDTPFSVTAPSFSNQTEV